MNQTVNKRNIVEEIKKIYIKYKVYILTGCTFLFFLFTMLFRLTHSALWGDEWVEYRYSQTAIKTGEFYKCVISTFQPPLYNFIMHFWLKINQSIYWFRFFNVCLGMTSAIFLFLMLKKLYNKRTAEISLCILAVCYYWIYCVQECSEYMLMLFFLFTALFFYIETTNKFSYNKMCFFILSCVGAMYSQYGSIFVVVPLLLLFYFSNILNKKIAIKRKVIITIAYIFSLIAFALPLYIFFAKVQLEHNGISNNSLSFDLKMCKDFPFILGRIIGYFFYLDTEGAWTCLWSIISILLLFCIILVILKGKLNWNKKSILVSLLIAYILHYFLVQLHIYAMVHPNMSAGFFSRYSYFYIPLLCVSLPIVFCEYYSLYSTLIPKKTLFALCGAGFLIMFLSFYNILENWNKALDNKFAEIWIENNGWEDKTYLLGMAKYGFNYYVSHSDNYQEGYLNNTSTSVDLDNLPNAFWVWRTNWGGDYQPVIDKANEMGYTVTIYEDSGYSGQLAYCYKKSEP